MEITRLCSYLLIRLNESVSETKMKNKLTVPPITSTPKADLFLDSIMVEK